MSLSQRLRRLKRYRTIATAFARNGLGYVTQEMGIVDKLLFFRGEEKRGIRAKSLGERIRLLLEELGPTFVKLGQLAGTRPDLLPADIVRQLERLQDRVAPFPFEQAAAIVEHELGDSVDRLFSEFGRTPLAAASIGQVYRGRLPDGSEVVVKVQRPNIHALIETDLGILADWARLAESRLEWARAYRLRDIVDELAKALKAELDYGTEARNAERFADRHRGMKDVVVPAIYWDYSTSRVLTMQYLEGIKLSDRKKMDGLGFSRRALAERYAKMIFRQALVDGFFHGDPHPGNVLVMPDGALAWLDFGMMGRLSPETKKKFAAFVIALRSQSSKGVLRAVSDMGVIPEEADRTGLEADIDELRDKYYQVPLRQVRLGEAVRDLFDVALRHRIRIPKELTLLGKTLLTMEGVVATLDPSFSVFDVAEPFGKKLFLDRLNPARLLKEWAEDLPAYIDLLNDIPLGLKQVILLLRRGNLRIEVATPQVDSVMAKLDRIGNRLSFSLVLLSLSILMLGLIVGAALSHARSVLWNVPVIEAGLGFAMFILLWLLLSIFRSGRF